MLKTPDAFQTTTRIAQQADTLYFAVHAGKFLVQNDTHALPSHTLVLEQALHQHPVHGLGVWLGRPVCAIRVPLDAPIPEGHHFAPLRDLFGCWDFALLGLASRALQVAEWAETHRFCGACGVANAPLAHERAMRCPQCQRHYYPRISPAMMVLIRRGEDILLARHTHSPSGRFSPLAGFLEAGETVEEAIHREVFEEVGLRVTNIQYFGSQSWPFPHSLMLAFTADYAGGEIVIDADEIAEAQWFGPSNMPAAATQWVSISSWLVQANWPHTNQPTP